MKIPDYNKISWFVTLLIAIIIFACSSTSFGSGSGPGFDIKPFIYHFIIFFYLGIFLTISLTNQKSSNKSLIIISLMIAIIYGILDETHQMFVPGRYFDYLDVLTDSVGILFANLVYIFTRN